MSPWRSPAWAAGRPSSTRSTSRPWVCSSSWRRRQEAGIGRCSRRHPQVGPAHPPLADQQPGHPAPGVDGDGEADPLGPGGDGRVDADHPPPGVHQRAPGVAGVERGVGLDHVLDQAPPVGRREGAPQGADHPGGDRRLQPVGVADGDRQLPHPQALRVPQRHGRELARRSSPARAPRPGRSWGLCPPPRRANVRPSGRLASSCRAFSTTWLLVRMYPSGVSTKPEPAPRTSKGPRWVRTSPTTERLTTDGPDPRHRPADGARVGVQLRLVLRGVRRRSRGPELPRPGLRPGPRLRSPRPLHHQARGSYCFIAPLARICER